MTVAVTATGQPVDPPPPEPADDRFTVIDLSDDWVPAPFADDPTLGDVGRVEYRDTLVGLANEDFGEGAKWRRARRDRFFEIYGIFPSLAVIRGRLLDDARHACHDRAAQFDLLPALGDGPPSPKAVRAAQAHLVCEGFLPAADGRRGPATKRALKLYQRMHMLLPTGRLDADTATAMLAGSRELDFRTLLRALRERTAAAAGLIEDGSAAGEYGQVLGRDLDAREFRHFAEGSALPDGAPDAISPATEAAARALGWTSPAAAVEWFRARPRDATRHFHIAVELPRPPSYHTADLQIRAEIARGDGEKDRPSLVLYAVTPDGDIPLVKWPTTVGGWQWEVDSSGDLVKRFKESPLGPRVWRNLIAGPAWFPPETTPPRELVGSSGRIRADAIGPGYASAYGLVMLSHERVSGPDRFKDTGIRTHGSVHVGSITRGHSHGCHRLFNHLAVRMASFILRHHPHVRRGPMEVKYVLEVEWKGETLRLSRKGRGYLWELTPPVPVNVVANRGSGDP